MDTKKGIKLQSSPLFPAEGVAHGFLSRVGGVSPPPFDSLNFDVRDGDSPENIEENKRLLAKAFSIPDTIFTLNQVHGNEVVIADNPFDRPDADAAITDMLCLPIGILTADCVPILFYDPVNRVIGAAHAGWRGTIKNIAIKTVEAMRKTFRTEPKSVIAAIGPYIGPCCYTVGESVVKEFEAAYPAISGLIVRDGATLKIDIGGYNLAQLTSIGLKKQNIYMAQGCTAGEKEFFSYRRDSGKTGRQLSFIMLR